MSTENQGPVAEGQPPALTKEDESDDDMPLAAKLKKTTPSKRKMVIDDDDNSEKKPETNGKDSNKNAPPPKKQATGSSAKKDDPKKAPTSNQKKDATKSTPKDGAKKEEPAKKSQDAKKASPAKKTETPVKKEAAPKKPAEDKKPADATKVKAEPETPKKEENGDKKKEEKTPAKSSTPAKKTDKKTPVKKETAKKADTPKKRKKEESESESDSSSDDGSSSGSESESDSEDDKPLVERMKKAVKKETPKKKATPKKETKSTPKKKAKKEEQEEDEEEDGKEKKKSRKRKDDDETPTYKWWKEPPLPEGKKWKTLEHNGVCFPPPYKAHGIKIYYDGKPIALTPEQEELATFFSQYLTTDHMKKPQFSDNFWKEFKDSIKKHKGEASVITDFKKIDFTPIHKHIMEQREDRKNRSKEDKQKEKEEKEKVNEKYGWAMVDGYKQQVANFRVEPPGLFLGRGNHPKAGMAKKRIFPEDVTLNLGPSAKVPEVPIPGHKWGKIEHNDEVAWLAMWKDTVTGGFKYVWLAPSSRVKGEADMRKFETARKLKSHIDKIRMKYTEELRSKDYQTRQRATALYVIDHLALRVGNEKDEDEADTVGCCSLRVEHIKLKDPNIIEFDFLGKDSMRYQNAVAVDEQVFKNFKYFCKEKSADEEIFDALTTSSLNNYLKSQMDGLTAKVFRTYNASITLEKELEKMVVEDEMSVDEKMLFYNRANREVAILCNHQRSVSKNFGEQIGKLDKQITELEETKDKLNDRLKKIKKGEKIKEEESESESDDDKEKDGEKKKKKQKLPTEPDKIKKAISKIEERIFKWKTKKTEKDELKEVSLTTSKINYIDPRISVAWAKKVDVPIEKIFSKKLRQKFPWAMDVDDDFRF